MESLVPIVGIEATSGRSSVHERLLELVESLGHTIYPLNSSTVLGLLRRDVRLTNIPFLLCIASVEPRLLVDDWVRNIKKKWRSSRVLELPVEFLIAALSMDSQLFALVREPDPPSLITEFAKAVYRELDNDNLCLSSLEKALGIGRHELERAFRKWPRGTAWKLAVRLRLWESARLLTDTNLQIGEIAIVVGYPDLPHFDKTFHSEFGLTPREFRKKNKLIETKHNFALKSQTLNLKPQVIAAI